MHSHSTRFYSDGRALHAGEVRAGVEVSNAVWDNRGEGGLGPSGGPRKAPRVRKQPATGRAIIALVTVGVSLDPGAISVGGGLAHTGIGWLRVGSRAFALYDIALYMILAIWVQGAWAGLEGLLRLTSRSLAVGYWRVGFSAITKSIYTGFEIRPLHLACGDWGSLRWLRCREIGIKSRARLFYIQARFPAISISISITATTPSPSWSC